MFKRQMIAFQKIDYVYDQFSVTSNTLLIVKHILSSQCIIMSALCGLTRGESG